MVRPSRQVATGESKLSRNASFSSRGLFIGVASDLGDVIAALDRDEPRVRAEAAERLGEPFEFVVGHSLIGKHQHMVLVEGGAQFSGLAIIDRCGVEAVTTAPQRVRSE